MECNSSDLNVSRQKRQRTEEDKTRSAMLDFSVLDCPICMEPLSIPIFQCDNGHLACSCCPKLKNKCPSCALPVGHSSCRAMETLLKSVFLPCQNAKYGCTETVAFGKEPTHEKDCTFAEYCCCPVRYCNYAGSYIDLYRHYVSSFHLYWQIFNEFCIGISCGIKMNISDKIFIQRATLERLLFAVQCFREPFGVYVTVSCIAPSIQEVGQFSYRLVYTVDGQTMTYKSSEMKKIREVSLQTPQDNYMLIPHSLLRGEALEMRLWIRMSNKE
ncbi:hypothetical protein F2Q70_00008894 [Brassica cretica]|uniref:RING-type E3 ubiquitin transferase n=1 Tax=Brassica cretica TaxID=69181 RepID=A0A8S9MCQ5_BRACR|nr:hypothetical protein F2Q70_00008894 [Brassica cretica]